MNRWKQEQKYRPLNYLEGKTDFTELLLKSVYRLNA